MSTSLLSRSGSSDRSRRLSLAVSAAVLLGACAEQATAPSTRLPMGKVYTSEAVLVAPGRRWEKAADGEGWLFRGISSLHAHVAAAPKAPLVFHYLPDEATSTYRFEVRWDGESLFSVPVRMPSEGLRIEIPPEKLAVGNHVLQVKRLYLVGRDQHDNVFPEVAYGFGDDRRALAPEELPRYRYFCDFLAFGLSGVSKVKRSGFLFDGPRSAIVAVDLKRAGHLHVETESFSRAPARFAIAAGDEEHETTVQPNAAGAFRLPLPAGKTTLRFSAEGDPDGLFLWGSPWIEQGTGEERTPVVLITVDTTRRDALSPYNGRPDLTPNIDELAGRATVYERAYSSAPWTLPSHASMFTGLYPSKHGVGVSTDRIGEEHVPLARRFRDAGYLAAGFAGGDLSSYRFGVGRGFHVFRDPERFETQGHRLTEAVEEFLEVFHREPLFLFVNYFDAHGPYRAPAKFQERVGLAEMAREVEDQPVWKALAAGESAGWRAVGRSDAPATPEGLRYLRGAYDSEVAFMDAQIGRLFRALRRHGLFDRSLIVLVGDHGELLGEGGYFGHSGRLDPVLTEVPLIVKWPHQKEGRRVSDLVSGVDVFPTILEAAGLEVPETDGVSLDPDGLREARRSQVFTEEHESRVHPLNPRLKISSHVYTVQRPDFRQVVWSGGTECQRQDETGWHGVPCEADGATVLGHVERILQARTKGRVDDAGAVSRETEESLKALGYL